MVAIVGGDGDNENSNQWWQEKWGWGNNDKNNGVNDKGGDNDNNEMKAMIKIISNRSSISEDEN